MILAVDAGNTRLKWGVFTSGGDLLKQGSCAYAKSETGWKVWGEYAPSHAVVAQVVGEPRLSLVRGWLQGIDHVQWLVPGARCAGVTNRYQEVARLGADRWAALIAAWHRVAAPCVVVSAGTALTVDALDVDGVFLGGIIVPGFALMQRSLREGTAQISQAGGVWQDWPDCTVNAVHSGVLSAMAGAIHAVESRLQSRSSRPVQCLLTGGDAALLAEQVTGIVIPELILQGLYVIATQHENGC